MQENPLVTVICSCYNHENFVIESLNSVINQDYKNIELIIIDDFSSDNSKKTIKNWLLNYPEIKFIANENNLGITKSFNNALKSAKGKYIIDLAADDILIPNCVDLQLKKFENSSFKNLGIVYGNAELIAENDDFISLYFDVETSKKIKTGNVYLSVLEGLHNICSVSAMVKKSVYDQLKGYDEMLVYEDLDFWIRASRVFDFDFIDTVLVQKRIVENSLGNDFYKKNKAVNQSTFLILQKAVALNKNKKEDLAILKRVHYEIVLSWKNHDFDLFLKNIFLKIKLFWRMNFRKY